MADTVTTTTSQSWFGRLKDSVGGVALGLLLFVLSFVVLWTNEGRSVKTFKGLQEGAKLVLSVPNTPVDQANDGKLVHMTGMAETKDMLSDPFTKLTLNKIFLSRRVEMYQWVEKSESQTKEKVGGGTETTTTYTYETKWTSEYKDSSKFNQQTGHVNPAKDLTGESWTAATVKFGDFVLNEYLITMMGGANKYQFTEADFSKIPTGVKARTTLQGDTLYVGRTKMAEPQNPQVGDYKVYFTVTDTPHPVSIVAKQIGKTFSAFTAKNGYKYQMIEDGTSSAEEMFANAQQRNRAWTWILRVLGFLMMAIGLGMVTKPLATLGAVIPILGRIIGTGLDFITFLLASVLSLITIAIAWIVYRPVLGIVLLCISIGIIVVIIKMKSKLKTAKKA